MNKVPERTDVIKVSVSEHVRLNLMLIFLEPGDIWRDVVNTWIITARKQEAHVHNDNFIIVLNGVHIFTNAHFADTTDWDNP